MVADQCGNGCVFVTDSRLIQVGEVFRRWKTVSVQPTAVVVEGEADTLKNIDTIDLPDIDIENMTEEKTWKVLIPPIDGVVMDPDEVDATLSIKKEE